MINWLRDIFLGEDEIENEEDAYIPTDLYDAINYLEVNDQELIHLAQTLSEEEFVGPLHHGYGTNIRNEWGLWYNETKISKWFVDRGIQHGDDRSGILLTSFWRKINAEPLNVDEQISYYRDYWTELDIDPDTMEPVS